MLLLLKIAGLLVAAAGGALALLGNPSRNHKLTRKGWCALSLLAIGFVTSFATELVTLRESKSSEQWEVMKTLPITLVIYDFRTKSPTTAADLIAALNKIEISYRVPSGILDGTGVRTVRWSFDAAVANVETGSRLQIVSKDRVIATSDVTLSLRTPRGWSSSVYDDWTRDEYKKNVGGIRALLSWKDHRFGPKITEVLHLSRFSSLRVVVPDDTFLDQFADAHIFFWATRRVVLSLDLKSLQYTDLTVTTAYEGRIASLDGVELLKLWKLR